MSSSNYSVIDPLLVGWRRTNISLLPSSTSISVSAGGAAWLQEGSADLFGLSLLLFLFLLLDFSFREQLQSGRRRILPWRGGAGGGGLFVEISRAAAGVLRNKRGGHGG